MNEIGGWEGGIPDFVGMYTYFRTLSTSSDERKRKLYQQALSKVNSISTELSNTQNIKVANDFIAQIAVSERGKELAAIQSYCKQMNTDFPSLASYFKDPNTIYDDPQHFYTNLTMAINKIRMGQKEYLQELKRIKRNLSATSRTVYSYRADDYRYKLVRDMTSFLSRLSGDNSKLEEMEKFDHYNGDTKFMSTIQDMVIRILDKSGVLNKISSGEDFAAIAASVLVDVEKLVQEGIDNSDGVESLTIDKVSEELLLQVESYYLSSIKGETNKQTPVQRALSDIEGIDFARITKNAKELLGIQTKVFKNENEKDQYLKKIKRDEKEEDIDLVYKLRNRLNKNKVLRKNLNLIDFSISGSYKTKHGTINELIQSMIGRNVKGNVGTDIITYTFNWKTRVNTEAYDTLIDNIGDAFSSVLKEEHTQQDQKKDVETIVSEMNDEVDKLIAATEEQMKKSEEFSSNDLFIFHESLKLYSSVETGQSEHLGFSGRSMNIGSYIGYLSAANSVGIKENPLNQNNLNFLARNLIPGAIADDKKDILEYYFSIYAGLLMFDDVSIMAKEAINQINASNNVIGGKVRQIHLYNLNGIYVPASMILTYISNSLSKIANINPKDFAYAQIKVSNISIPTYKELTPQIWEAIASQALSAVQVKIILLQTFTQFINLLPE